MAPSLLVNTFSYLIYLLPVLNNDVLSAAVLKKIHKLIFAYYSFLLLLFCYGASTSNDWLSHLSPLFFLTSILRNGKIQKNTATGLIYWHKKILLYNLIVHVGCALCKCIHSTRLSYKIIIMSIFQLSDVNNFCSAVWRVNKNYGMFVMFHQSKKCNSVVSIHVLRRDIVMKMSVASYANSVIKGKTRLWWQVDKQSNGCRKNSWHN